MSRLSIVVVVTLLVVSPTLPSWSGAGTASAGQGDDVTLQLGASVSYVQDLNDPSGSGGSNAATYASMEQDESFNIDLIQLAVSGSRGRASYYASLDFGDLAAFAGDSIAGDVALQEANLTYELDALAVTAGRFGTPFGQEVLQPWGNTNIGRSWSWQGQPINHDGLTLSSALGSTEVMLGAVNSFTVNDPGGNDADNEKGILGSFGSTISDALNLHAAAIFSKFGDSVDQQMYNIIVSGTLSPTAQRSIRYALTGNYRNNDPNNAASMEFWSAVLYGGTDFGATAIDVRLEYMDDDGIVLGANTSLWSVTTTLSWTLTDGVVARAEYRHDDADDPIFADGTSMDDALDTLQAQLVWYPEL